MSEEIQTPILSYEDIRQHSDTFLATHHPSRTLPIPIEEIIDLQLEINIVPLPGLQQVFEIEAFTTSDCTEIYVDEFVYRRRPGRYRFSLAHELGHIILHRHLFELTCFRTVQEWKAFITEFPGDEYEWFEYQAYSFAGLVLVPREALESEAEDALRKAIGHRIPVDIQDAIAWDYIADYIAGRFVVSKEVIIKRLEKDGIRSVEWLRRRGLLF